MFQNKRGSNKRSISSNSGVFACSTRDVSYHFRSQYDLSWKIVVPKKDNFDDSVIKFANAPQPSK